MPKIPICWTRTVLILAYSGSKIQRLAPLRGYCAAVGLGDRRDRSIRSERSGNLIGKIRKEVEESPAGWVSGAIMAAKNRQFGFGSVSDKSLTRAMLFQQRFDTRKVEV